MFEQNSEAIGWTVNCTFESCKGSNDEIVQLLQSGVTIKQTKTLFEVTPKTKTTQNNTAINKRLGGIL